MKHRGARILLTALGVSAFMSLTAWVPWRAALGLGEGPSGDALWVSNGPFGGTVRLLVIDPITPGTIDAAGDGGVFKSVDGASTWKPARDGITELTIDAVAVDPTNSQIVYAGSNGGGGVFKSTDGGLTWSQQVNGLQITTIKSLAV